MMKTTKTIKVPTGEIYIATGEKGLPLEFLSVGDYGKSANIKADFLGITREINGVPNGTPMPLSENGLLLYLLSMDVLWAVSFVWFRK